MTTPQSPQPDPLTPEELDDLREHFVNGSGAFTDSAMVGRLVIEIDRLRAPTPIPSPDTDLRAALAAWLDSHGEADIEDRLAEAAKAWLGDAE